MVVDGAVLDAVTLVVGWVVSPKGASALRRADAGGPEACASAKPLLHTIRSRSTLQARPRPRAVYCVLHARYP